MAKIKLCNYNRLCSKIGLFTNMFMKCSVLIFGRRQTLRRKLYCWSLGLGRISFNGSWLGALVPQNNFLSCICMISLTFNELKYIAACNKSSVLCLDRVHTHQTLKGHKLN